VTELEPEWATDPDWPLCLCWLLNHDPLEGQAMA